MSPTPNSLTSIELEWKNYVRQVGLDKAPTQQRTEMRKAFYAGQFAFHTWQIGFVAKLDNPVEAEKALAAREEELKAFFKSVGA